MHFTPCISLLVTDPHPPETLVENERRIDSRKPLYENGFHHPPVRKPQALIESDLSLLMLLRNAEQFSPMLHKKRIGEVPGLLKDRQGMKVQERTG